jgi:glycosyltransferase involved in cell wall biosynthesis
MDILFITPQDVNDQAGNGGVKGAAKNLKLLKSMDDANVHLCILRKREFVEDHTSNLIIDQPQGKLGELIAALLGYKKIYPWKVKKIQKYIINNGIDIVFLDGSLLGNLTKMNKYCRTVVFFHNCEYDFSCNKVKNEGIVYLPSAIASWVNEKKAVNAGKIGCLNNRDSNRIFELYGRRADFFFPVTFEDTFDPTRAKESNKKELLFVGSRFKPNEDSIEWFMKNVMAFLPDITLLIVGKGFEDKKAEYESAYSNVTVLGGVNDLSDYYYSHPVQVMPILYGAGMKVKTAEAMMYGRTIVASDEALEGYDVDGMDGIYRCNTADEYIRVLSDLMIADKSETYNVSVRNCFMQKYETSLLLEAVRQAINDWD